MKRITKDPETRRAEILAAAGELFAEQGYGNTSVDAIVQHVGVAKGTFYYYFKSKEDVLVALAQAMVDRLREDYEAIADDPAIGAVDKLRQILRGENRPSEHGDWLMESLHRPENRELHERISVVTIVELAPVLARVIEQGKQEAVFDVEDPLETVQFLLAGSQFLLESGLFDWNQDEQMKRARAMQAVIERALRAAPGTFSFM